jgi:hypothetical protein
VNVADHVYIEAVKKVLLKFFRGARAGRDVSIAGEEIREKSYKSPIGLKPENKEINPALAIM